MTQAKAVSNYTNSILANMEAVDDGYDAVSYTHLTLPTNREV